MYTQLVVKFMEHEPSGPRLQDLSPVTAARSLKWNVTVPCGIRAVPLDVFFTVAVALYLQTGIPLYDELAESDTVVSAGVMVIDKGDDELRSWLASPL